MPTEKRENMYHNVDVNEKNAAAQLNEYRECVREEIEHATGGFCVFDLDSDQTACAAFGSVDSVSDMIATAANKDKTTADIVRMAFVKLLILRKVGELKLTIS